MSDCNEQKSERIPIMFEPSLVDRIDDFRFSNRIVSRGAAIRKLVSSALDNDEMKKGSEVSA